MKKGAALAHSPKVSVFARQVDDVVHEIEGDFVERKIGELDLLRKHGAAIAVLTRELGRAVGSDFQRPHLKLLGCDAFVVGLDQRDFVQQPISLCGVGDILCAVGEGDPAIDPVAIPVFAAGELAQVGFGKCLGHGVSLSHWFWVASADATLASPRTGVASARDSDVASATFLGAPPRSGGGAKTLYGTPLRARGCRAPLATGRVCGRVRMREEASPEWAETPSAPRALARSTRPAGTRHDC